MLITKEVEVKWFHKTKEHYMSKGYIYTKPFDTFMVKIEDLSEGSHICIELCCDYCGSIFTRKYYDHITIAKKDLVKMDACNNCKISKQLNKLDYKLNNNTLNKSSNGYWKSKTNRMKELKLYIDKYNTLEKLYSTNEESFKLWNAFSRYKHDLYEATFELGYNPNILGLRVKINNIYNYYPKGYFNDFENLSGLITIFIKQYKHFPTIDELFYEYHITDKIIKKYGGVEKIRARMGYINKNEYVDDNNFKNKSSYEFIVAQFLIHNGVSYLREQNPFPNDENNYRSDFTFYINNIPIHCEIWGFKRDTLRNYSKDKLDKVKLYDKYNLELMSIEQDLFLDNYENIQNKLKLIFEPILNKTMNVVRQEHILTNLMSDEELCAELMAYSNDKLYLPVVQDLKNNGKYMLYDEAFKRFGSYSKFALKFGLKTKSNENNYWTKEICLQNGLILLHDGTPIHQPILRKINQNSLVIYILKYFENVISYKLELFQLYSGILPEYEIIFLNNVTNNIGTNIKNKVTPKQQQLAKEILDKYNSK